MDRSVRNFDTIKSYTDILGVECSHPLVCVVNLNLARKMYHMMHTNSFYSLYLKDEKNCSITYGRRDYDYSEGSVVALAPGQVIGMHDNGEKFQPKGWALFFHPDLLKGTELGHCMKEYSFFKYKVNEALHLSEDERAQFLSLLEQTDAEIRSFSDDRTRRTICSYIHILLDHCLRFYERQFSTRRDESLDILSKFEDILFHYYDHDAESLPTVKWCADQLCLSPNYLGDLMKKETGMNAKDQIHGHILFEVKARLEGSADSVSAISEQLGFQYPQHLTRFFKSMTGMTPMEYRNSLMKPDKKNEKDSI